MRACGKGFLSLPKIKYITSPVGWMLCPQERSGIAPRSQRLQDHTWLMYKADQGAGRKSCFHLRRISALHASLLSFTSLLTNIACIAHMNSASQSAKIQTCANSIHLPINGILLFSSRFTMNGSPVQNTAMASKKVEWGATISTGASDCETWLERNEKTRDFRVRGKPEFQSLRR